MNYSGRNSPDSENDMIEKSRFVPRNTVRTIKLKPHETAPGPNAKCPCGSNRKWKKCHGGKVCSVVETPKPVEAKSAEVKA